MLILTGLTKTKGHEFNLEYVGAGHEMKCWAKCKCGFSCEIRLFRNYGGVKELERAWEGHIGKNGK